jgi:hypothetical protein
MAVTLQQVAYYQQVAAVPRGIARFTWAAGTPAVSTSTPSTIITFGRASQQIGNGWWGRK